MHNPYAASAAAGAAQGSTPFAVETSGARDYEDAIGPNAAYYRARFEQYDAHGPALSWHWPAFFATSAWYVYRKMYLAGILNFLWPWILSFVIGLLMVWGLLSTTVGGATVFALWPVPWLVLTLGANRFYWRRIRNVIGEMPAYGDPGRRSRELASAGGVARGPMTAMAVVMVLYVVVLFGVIMAITIPAYQDYQIRAQVTEGLNLTFGLKRAVEDYRARHGQWPADLAALGEREETGKFTESVTVEQGSVVITYGREAHRKLQGLRLTWLPGVGEQGEVFWACGDAAMPVQFAPGDGPRGSELPAKYMPAYCRVGGTDYATSP